MIEDITSRQCSVSLSVSSLTSFANKSRATCVSVNVFIVCVFNVRAENGSESVRGTHYLRLLFGVVRCTELVD